MTDNMLGGVERGGGRRHSRAVQCLLLVPHPALPYLKAQGGRTVELYCWNFTQVESAKLTDYSSCTNVTFTISFPENVHVHMWSRQGPVMVVSLYKLNKNTEKASRNYLYLLCFSIFFLFFLYFFKILVLCVVPLRCSTGPLFWRPVVPLAHCSARVLCDAPILQTSNCSLPPPFLSR